MSVSFNTIPSDIRVPLFWAEMDNSQASTASASASPALIIGTVATGSTIARNTLTIMPSADLAGKIAGRGSQLHRMVARYRAIDPFGELWVLAVDEPTGALASGSLTVTGTAQASGTISLYIGAVRVQASVVTGDSAEDVAATLAAAINANADLPVVATAASGEVTVNARHKGLTGNDTPMMLNYYGTVGGETTPDGIAVAITAMAGGSGAPDLTATVAAMGDEPFDFIGLPFCDSASLATLALEMNDTSGRWSYARQLYGHVYSAKIGSLSDLVTFGDTLNNQHTTVAGYEPATQTCCDELVAMRTARNAVFIRADPARPTQTGELTGALPAPKGSRFILSEQQSLLTHGIATSYASSGALCIQRDITTYQQNAYGVADNSYLDSETLHTSAYVLRQLKSIVTTKYPRHKLANDGTRFGDGQAIVTPAVLKGEMCSVYRTMERAGIVENFDIFKQYLVVERNASDPDRVDVLFPPDYVNQLRVFALVNQFRLQYDEESE
ncbi:MAG: phage tail sheath C-terminal domain-containing protein [Pantoea sp.]|uniref:phage tail sheath subtilisin-like domain-containing protein n=1 Tax=Pantoea sp. TaxID=69393 RepID=UPI0039E5DE17